MMMYRASPPARVSLLWLIYEGLPYDLWIQQKRNHHITSHHATASSSQSSTRSKKVLQRLSFPFHSSHLLPRMLILAYLSVYDTKPTTSRAGHPRPPHPTDGVENAVGSPDGNETTAKRATRGFPNTGTSSRTKNRAGLYNRRGEKRRSVLSVQKPEAQASYAIEKEKRSPRTRRLSMPTPSRADVLPQHQYHPSTTRNNPPHDRLRLPPPLPTRALVFLTPALSVTLLLPPLALTFATAKLL